MIDLAAWDDEPSRRLAVLVAAGAFAVLLVFGLWSWWVAPHVCDPDRSYEPSIIALELARSNADLEHIFTGPKCEDHMRDRLRATGVWGDTLAFIPAYGLYLIFAFIALRRRAGSEAAIAIGLVAIAVLTDQLENICLAHIIDDPALPGAWLTALEGITAIKWLALAFAGVFGGVILRRFARWGYPSIAAIALGSIGIVLAVIRPVTFGPWLQYASLMPFLAFAPFVAFGAWRSLSRGGA
jgi:hypothetical protein